MSRPAPRFLWPLVWSLLVTGSLVTLLVMNATAREVAGQTAKTLFGIFSTPFILEASVGFIGLCMLLLINEWRLKKEGDGWVYLLTQDTSTAGTLPASASQRLQGVVMQEKPETLDEALAERSLIEGYLELGMASEARQELNAQMDLPDDAATAALRVRVLAANLDTAPAQQLLHESADRFPQQRLLLLQAALESAQWLEQHLSMQTEAVRSWRENAHTLGEGR